jgi:membrane associated rhomboid family serine protease
MSIFLADKFATEIADKFTIIPMESFMPSRDVAYFAHIGGFITGMPLRPTIRRSKKKAQDAKLHV